MSWIEENDTVPFDDHDAFALDSHVEVNEKTPSASIIRLSTKNLISLAKRRKHVCADATYKLIWHVISLIIYINVLALTSYNKFLLFALN